MLSDEERKAIDYLQLCYDLSTITNESLSKLGIVLNLIEKQSKEIEELKDKFSDEKIRNTVIKRYREVIEKDYVSKDKIKAKIEELEKGNKNTFIRGEKILVLQSLLEKE